MFETIDNCVDFKIYMQNYAYAHGGASRGRSREEPVEEGFVSFPVASVMHIDWGKCHGSTGSPSALSEEDSKGGVTVLEGSKVLARGTRSCT